MGQPPVVVLQLVVVQVLVVCRHGGLHACRSPWCSGASASKRATRYRPTLGALWTQPGNFPEWQRGWIKRPCSQRTRRPPPGQRPRAQQRLIGVGQDHPLSIGVLLNLLPELLGLLELPTHPRWPWPATRLVEIDGHATLPALHASDRRLIAGSALQPDRRRPCREHPLEAGRSPSIVSRHSQRLGDLFDEALPVGWTRT